MSTSVCFIIIIPKPLVCSDDRCFEMFSLKIVCHLVLSSKPPPASCARSAVHCAKFWWRDARRRFGGSTSGERVSGPVATTNAANENKEEEKEKKKSGNGWIIKIL